MTVMVLSLSCSWRHLMDRATFWKIIDISRNQANGDLDVQVARLQSQLEQLGPTEIVDFGRLFEEYSVRAYTWDL